jgi:hypothetical protein
MVRVWSSSLLDDDGGEVKMMTFLSGHAFAQSCWNWAAANNRQGQHRRVDRLRLTIKLGRCL